MTDPEIRKEAERINALLRAIRDLTSEALGRGGPFNDLLAQLRFVIKSETPALLRIKAANPATYAALMNNATRMKTWLIEAGAVVEEPPPITEEVGGWM